MKAMMMWAAVAVAGCVPAAQHAASPPPRLTPPFHVETVAHGTTVTVTVSAGSTFAHTDGAFDTSAGYRIRAVARDGRVVAERPLSAEAHYVLSGFTASSPHTFELPLGDFELQVLGGAPPDPTWAVKPATDPHVQTVEAQVRIAKTRNLDGSVAKRAFLHTGTRLWPAARRLTIARFWPSVRPWDPVVVEWRRGGTLVARVPDKREGDAFDRLSGATGQTLWHFGESYAVPAEVLASSGHWSARVYALESPPIEVELDIASGSVVMADDRVLWDHQPAVASVELVQHAIAPDPSIAAALARRAPGFPVVPDGDRNAFAPPIPMTPELARAITRVPELAREIAGYELVRHPMGAAGEFVHACAGPCPDLSPEQRYRQHQRDVREDDRATAAINADRRATVPRTRARLVAQIAKFGKPFAAAEYPQ